LYSIRVLRNYSQKDVLNVHVIRVRVTFTTEFCITLVQV